MRVIFDPDESAIVGYTEIGLDIKQFEFNTKVIQSASEPRYMGDEAPEMVLNYILSITGINPVIKTNAK